MRHQMLIKSKKILFFHIPKTGGNSITNALINFSEDTKRVRKNHDGENRFEIKSSISRKIQKHSDFGDYYKVLGPKIFAYQKFAVLRNPFDRVESFYFSPHRNMSKYDEKVFYQMLKNMKTFPNFVSGGRFDDIQTCIDAGTINEIIPFENLSLSLHNYLSKFDLNIKLTHVNKSSPNKSLPWTDEMIGAVKYKFHNEIKFGNFHREL